MEEAELLLRDSWEHLISRYTSGKIVLRNEKDMEDALKDICQELTSEPEISLPIVSQEHHRGRIVDLRMGETDSCILIQLKFYHDKADWKETPSMTNTVESDLKFAKDHKDTYVGIIDTIPTTTRAKLLYILNWELIEIDKQVFDEIYSNINPRTSPPRESKQNVLLAKGTEI